MPIGLEKASLCNENISSFVLMMVPIRSTIDGITHCALNYLSSHEFGLTL